uniref:alpha-tectorin-like n=1 Tax=Pristiophorus japonicus TaxID=55135 RepID=UPI00398E4BCD
MSEDFASSLFETANLAVMLQDCSQRKRDNKEFHLELYRKFEVTRIGESDLFYPFGEGAGDTKNPKIDDGGSPEISISTSFPFFETSHTSLYVNNNGVVSFGVSVSQYTPNTFPLSDDRAFIAPFWADVDNNRGGEVYYRETRDAVLLQRATADVNRYTPGLKFQARWIFVATWDRVGYFGSRSTKVNSFQAVLITDGFQSFILLNYRNIQWTTGTSSGGKPDTGLGGTPAQAGFNSGSSTHYFSVPGSQTPEIVDVESTSNVNEPGRWVFRTDVFSVVGGCIYNGTFIRQDHTFWKNSTCQTKCTCGVGNSLDCVSEPCGPSEICISSSTFYTCKTTSVKTCTIFGDPHFYTFDGQLFHFQGTCTYVLSELCSSDAGLRFYRVEAKNENRGNVAVSWTRMVRLLVDGTEITMLKGAVDRVLVNGTRSSVPVVIGGGRIRIQASGFSVAVSTDFGLGVTFDGSHHVTISLPARYQNATCGLCGNMNGDQQDEFRMPDGSPAGSEEDFGRSWKVADNDSVCRDRCGSECQVCTAQQKVLYGGENYCGIMSRQEGPFSFCNTVLPAQPFIQSCVYDLCASDGYRPNLCQALQTYSDRCRTEGVPTISWRGPGLCEIPCPAHNHYDPCSNACPASCSDTTAPLYCDQPCTESCRCDDGYILSGGTCVALSQCGCSFQGRYYSRGDTVVLTETCSKKCTCWNATLGLTCEDFGCGLREDCRLVDGVRDCYPRDSATCWAAGDPHYHTFDGKAFDFQGTCRYTFSKYCDPAGNLNTFSVEVANDHRGSTAVSWTRLVEVQVYGHRIQVTRGERGKVQVNGETINLPVSLESGKVRVTHSGSAAVLWTDFGLSVSYDWNHYAAVTVPGTYSGSLCGLCGDYNGDASDDFTSLNGTAISGASVFGNSWKSPTSGAGCSDDTGLAGPVCGEGARGVYASGSHCGILSKATGPFRQCHPELSPAIYSDNCEFDLCALAGDHTTLCQAIGSYASECQRRGITIGDWRNATGCEMGCGANSHYELCGSTCPASCADLGSPSDCPTPCGEGCQCDNRFVLSGEGCVPLAQCGCLQNGVYRTAGEEWRAEGCRRLCRCDGATNTVRCVNATCGPQHVCGLSGGRASCVSASAVCWASGDPHYRTFDGLRYDFQGTCSYVLAALCGAVQSPAHFEVEVKNERWRESAVSVTAEVLVRVYGNEIHLERGNRGNVKLNGLRVNLPLSLANGTLRVYLSGAHTRLVMDFGLAVQYDGSYHVSVTVPRSLAGQTCGLCGDFNGDAADDLVTRDGRSTPDAFEFASSWRAGTDDGCDDGCRGSCPVCADAAPYRRADSCGIIADGDGPLGACHSQLSPDPYMSNCLYDVCLAAGSNDILCQSIQTYVSACQSLNVTLGDWRNQSSCSMSCPAHSHYDPCTTACPASCSDTTAPLHCDLPCTESCACDDGYILSGGTCVALSQCGCSFQGRYYSRGDTVVLTETCSRRCTCGNTPPTLTCEDSRCGLHEDCRLLDGVRDCYPRDSATCWAVGDPHYHTFDGKAFDFQGTCRYTFSKYCGQAANLTTFSVEVENDHRGSTAVSWTRKYQQHV